MPKYGKNRSGTSLTFHTASFHDFDVVPSVGAAVANTVVQQTVVLPQRCKILKVATVYSAIGTGTHKFNIVAGQGAPGVAIIGTDTLSVAGNTVFNLDQTLTAAAGALSIFIPTNTDAVWDTVSTSSAPSPLSGSVLTLRVVTPATTGSLTNFKVSLLIEVADPLTAHSGAISGVDY